MLVKGQLQLEDFKMVRGTPSVVESEVNRLKKDGYELHGQPQLYQPPDGNITIFVQAMAKYKEV